jgi:hypothetical protein
MIICEVTLNHFKSKQHFFRQLGASVIGLESVKSNNHIQVYRVKLVHNRETHCITVQITINFSLLTSFLVVSAVVFADTLEEAEGGETFMFGMMKMKNR